MKKALFFATIFAVLVSLAQAATVTEVVKGQVVSIKADFTKCENLEPDTIWRAPVYSCQTELERGLQNFNEYFGQNYRVKDIETVMSGMKGSDSGTSFTVGLIILIELKPASERPAPLKPEAETVKKK